MLSIRRCFEISVLVNIDSAAARWGYPTKITREGYANIQILTNTMSSEKGKREKRREKKEERNGRISRYISRVLISSAR
jgi:ribonuclease PH